MRPLPRFADIPLMSINTVVDTINAPLGGAMLIAYASLCSTNATNSMFFQPSNAATDITKHKGRHVNIMIY
jgi:hypothetical protein